MRHRPKSQLNGLLLMAVLLIALIQLYLFETVLGALLDGQRGMLPGALVVSVILSAIALYLAFLAPRLDREP